MHESSVDSETGPLRKHLSIATRTLISIPTITSEIGFRFSGRRTFITGKLFKIVSMFKIRLVEIHSISGL